MGENVPCLLLSAVCLIFEVRALPTFSGSPVELAEASEIMYAPKSSEDGETESRAESGERREGGRGAGEKVNGKTKKLQTTVVTWESLNGSNACTSPLTARRNIFITFYFSHPFPAPVRSIIFFTRSHFPPLRFESTRRLSGADA